MPSSALSLYQHLTCSRRDIEEFEDTKRAFRINPQIEGQTTQ